MQTRMNSFIEAITNAVIGLVLSFLFTWIGLALLFDVNFTAQQSVLVTGCYFVISTARSYVLRRMFNG